MLREGETGYCNIKKLEFACMGIIMVPRLNSIDLDFTCLSLLEKLFLTAQSPLSVHPGEQSVLFQRCMHLFFFFFFLSAGAESNELIFLITVKNNPNT